MQDMQEGAYSKKKKKSVAGQFAAVKYRSGTYCWTESKTKQGRLRGSKYLVLFFLSLLRFEISQLRLRFLAG
jgi:hypothetical protein